MSHNQLLIISIYTKTFVLQLMITIDTTLCNLATFKIINFDQLLPRIFLAYIQF